MRPGSRRSQRSGTISPCRAEPNTESRIGIVVHATGIQRRGYSLICDRWGASGAARVALGKNSCPEHCVGKFCPVLKLLSLRIALLPNPVQGSSEGWWRSVFGAAIAPCLLLVVGLLCGASPESPQWLARHGRGQQAKDVIQVLQGLSTKEADEWLRAELVLADKGSRSRNDAAWDELLLPEHRRTLTICSGLALLQALGGSNAVIYFAATMFESSNGAGSHFTATLMVGIFNLLGTVFALRLSDVLGRRPLLLGSFAGMAAGMAALAAAQLPMVAALQPCAAAAVATAAVPAYILAFGCGVGPLPPLLYSEVGYRAPRWNHN